MGKSPWNEKSLLCIRGDRSEKRPARTKKQKQPPCADMTLNVE